MKTIRNACLIAGIFLARFLHAQDTNTLSDFEVELQALEATTPMPASELPDSSQWHGFYSAQNPENAPMPADVLGLDFWPLGEGFYVVDDTNVDYAALAQTMSRRTVKGLGALAESDGLSADLSLDTNSLWLQINGVSNGVAYLTLNGTTDEVYEVMSKTDLTQTNWNIEEELWPSNDPTPFTVPVLERTNALFFWARDWTGVTENGNTVPDWWFWKYFGTTDLSDTNLDSLGDTLLEDYENGFDPNVISFTVRLGNRHFNTTGVTGSFVVLGGAPSYEAVLVNADPSTNTVTWTAYDGVIDMALGPTDGVYQVWYGLKGHAPDATPTWLGTTVYLDRAAPQIIVTNPVANVTAAPYVQVQGCAPEQLQSLTFDVSNAAATLTNQAGQILGGSFFDTNLMEYTTDYFQCFDVLLTNGLNAITVHATDLAGNVTTTNFNVTLDYSVATNPAIGLTWPANGMEICQSNFTVRGWTEDSAAQVTAQIVDTNNDTNIVSGVVERTGVFWVENLPLSAGTNELTLWVTNSAGLSSTTNLYLVKSDLTMTLDNVEGDLWRPTVNVSGRVSDATATVYVNGVQGTNHGDGTWSAQNVPVASGGVASFDFKAIPEGGGDPDGNMDADKPTEVVMESAHQTQDTSDSSPGPEDEEDTEHQLDYSDADGGTIHNVTQDYDTNGVPTGTVTEDIEYGPGGGFIAEHIDDGDGDAFDITNGEDGLTVAQEEGSLSWQADAGEFSGQETSKMKMTLRVGGKGVAGEQELAEGAATAVEELAETPFRLAVDVEAIAVGQLGRQGSDGAAYGTVAAGATEDVTPQTDAAFFDFTDNGGAGPLTHTTECTAPGNTNNSRTTIGIGEVVNFGGMPGKTKWSVSGNGTISSTNGGGTTFTASMSPGGATVTATIGSVSIPTTFNIIAPSSIKVTNHQDNPSNLGTENQSGTQMGAFTTYTDEFGPTTVSFNNVLFRENTNDNIVTVTWPNGTNTIETFDMSSGFVLICGNPFLPDNISKSLVPISYIFNGTSYIDFSYSSSWTDQYKNASGVWVDFSTLTTTYSFRGSDKKCRITYLGVPGSWQGPY